MFKKEDLVPSEGEDPRVKREMRIRSRVCGVYNRQESDFVVEGKGKKECRMEYYKYLEFVEVGVHPAHARIVSTLGLVFDRGLHVV